MEPDSLPAPDELRDAFRTLTGVPASTDPLASRLQFVEELLAEAGPLPPVPIILWREGGNPVQHKSIGQRLVVGRQTGQAGLSFSEDKLLSREHFVIHAKDKDWLMEDLDSRNGTAVNRTANRVQSKLLRDGDLIFAGDHVFVFLHQGRIT